MAITFYTVDVGHGLCQVILFEGRRAILIDGGGKIGKPVAEEFLKRYVDVIVAYVATHNDKDHVGAAPELLNKYPTAETLEYIWMLLDRPAKKPEQHDEDVIPLLGYAERRKARNTIKGRPALYIDDSREPQPCHKVIHSEPAENAELQLLYPKIMDVTDSFLRGTPNKEATNESSAILRLVVGDTRSKAAALITGDANCQGFRQARVVYKFNLSARVLSVPHHGGVIPQPAGAESWDEIVGWVAPEIAVVSAGLGTVPSTTTIKRTVFDPLRKHGAKIGCTQITKHCHDDFDTLHPSVLPVSLRSYPQMSGRKEFPKAVGCYGTIAVKVDGAGKPELVDFDRHQQAVTSKFASGSLPYCRER